MTTKIKPTTTSTIIINASGIPTADLIDYGVPASATIVNIIGRKSTLSAMHHSETKMNEAIMAVANAYEAHGRAVIYLSNDAVIAMAIVAAVHGVTGGWPNVAVESGGEFTAVTDLAITRITVRNQKWKHY